MEDNIELGYYLQLFLSGIANLALIVLKYCNNRSE